MGLNFIRLGWALFRFDISIRLISLSIEQIFYFFLASTITKYPNIYGITFLLRNILKKRGVYD